MTSTASRPAAPRVRPQRLAQQRSAQQRLTEQRAHQQRLRQAAGLGRPPLLEDKLRVPRLTLEVLRRRRVTEPDRGRRDRHRVTVVSGPAGAGKTVACAAWAAARPAARQPAWLTVDAEDRDPARFWPYVLAALVRARAVGADEAGQLAAAPPEAYPLRIVAAARSLAEPVVLVSTTPTSWRAAAALAGLDLLIKHAPAGLRLVLSGRCLPGLALSRLRVAGEVADVGAADLACTPEEADAYFAMLGLAPGRRPERAELLARTRGLDGRAAAGPHGPAAGGRGHRERPGRPGGRSCRGGPGGLAEPAAAGRGAARAAVTEYMRDEVLGRQLAASRAFMLRRA